MKRFLFLALTLFSLVFGFVAFYPPRKIILVLEKVPTNTPEGAAIFVTGNFNYWDPGDGNFKLETDHLGKYWIELPYHWGDLEFKFTRGDWTSVEGDACGHHVDNRQASTFLANENKGPENQIFCRVLSWEDVGPVDCEKVIIRLAKIPKETPASAPIYIAGSFNDWNGGHPNARFKYSERGFYYYPISKTDKEIEYKITRGNWSTEEVDENGDRIPNRKFVFGKKDTVDIEVPGWLDIKPGMEERKVTFLVSTPIGTPPGDPVYIVGSFNKWFPGDPKYQLKKMKPNLFSITITKPEGEMEYKFTRGNWGMEEMDVFGNHISNRKLRTSADTVRISIPEWRDIPIEQTYTVPLKDLENFVGHPDVMAFPPADGEDYVLFKLVNQDKSNLTLYVRLSLPNVPGNRNYGFVARLSPNESYYFSCPSATKIYACDGKYWNDFKPKETLVLMVEKGYQSVEMDAGLLAWKPYMKGLEMKDLRKFERPLNEEKKAQTK